MAYLGTESERVVRSTKQSKADLNMILRWGVEWWIWATPECHLYTFCTCDLRQTNNFYSYLIFVIILWQSRHFFNSISDTHRTDIPQMWFADKYFQYLILTIASAIPHMWQTSQVKSSDKYCLSNKSSQATNIQYLILTVLHFHNSTLFTLFTHAYHTSGKCQCIDLKCITLVRYLACADI